MCFYWLSSLTTEASLCTQQSCMIYEQRVSRCVANTHTRTHTRKTNTLQCQFSRALSNNQSYQREVIEIYLFKTALNSYDIFYELGIQMGLPQLLSIAYNSSLRHQILQLFTRTHVHTVSFPQQLLITPYSCLEQHLLLCE